MCAASVYREGGTSAKKINEFILLCFRFALSLQLLNDDGRWGHVLVPHFLVESCDCGRAFIPSSRQAIK
jgi:hypothetical protein